MKNPPQVKPGDRVRVVLEGDASISGSYGFYIDNDDDDAFVKLSADYVVSVEVLAKQFKVGDTVKGDDYAKLPVGTVVKDTGGARVKVADAFWRTLGSERDTPQNYLGDPRTIVFLP